MTISSLVGFENGLGSGIERPSLTMLKMFLLYIALPQIVGLILFGGILKVRGKKLSFVLAGAAIVGVLLFLLFGLSELGSI